MDDGTESSATTRRAVSAEAGDVLQGAAIERSQQEARWIVQEVLGCSGAALTAHPCAPVSPSEYAEIRRLLTRRAQGEPLQYVLEHVDFRNLRLRVTPDVLIPRSDTEIVVEVALHALRSGPASPRVLDIGTGSGCIALALKDEHPSGEIYGCDISEKALHVARQNGERLGLEVTFMEADMRSDDFTRQMPGRFDVIVSNPPYVVDEEAPFLSTSVRDHEPPVALFAGQKPFQFYRFIIQHTTSLLKKGGALVFETHAAYGAEVVRLCEKGGFSDVQLRRDLHGRERVVIARDG